MKFNYQSEFKKFKAERERMIKTYREAGMDEESISKMLEYDWELFKKERIFCLHNQPIEDFDKGDSNSEETPLMKRFKESLSVEDDYMNDETCEWIESLENPALVNGLKALKPKQLKIMELLIVNELTHEEIAEELGLERSTVTRNISRIKNKIKKYF